MATIKRKNKFTNKFRFAIFNDTTHEVLFSFRSNGAVFIATILLTMVLLVVSVTALISLTSLREFIPGYPSAESRRDIIENAIRLDSLQREITLWRLQLTNIQRVVTGKEPISIDSVLSMAQYNDTYSANPQELAKSDSLLRKQVMKEEQFNVGQKTNKIEQIEGLHFFPPVKGVITQEYNLAINHPFTDIAAPENSVVSSVLEGSVIGADYSEQNGYVIQIQHENNLISIYKHNTKLLKKVGDRVSAGTPIALVGNTGTLSTGVHLHFELWHNGEPLNPAEYIKF